jgi:general secretion pathway protein E
MFTTLTQIGQILLSQGKVTEEQLDAALREHYKNGDRVGTALVKLGYVTEDDVQRALADQLHLPFVRPVEMAISKEVIDRIPAKIVSRYHLVPVAAQNGTLSVACTDPLDIHMLDELRLSLRVHDIEPLVSTRKDIADAIKKYYGIGAATVEELMADGGSQSTDVIRDIEDIEEMDEDASIVRFVNQIIQEAMAERATDIHVEPFEQELRIRYRIDGLLYEQAIPPTIKRFQSAIISRIKIMADLNIAERRLPQDGKIKIKAGDREFDLRVSTVPTAYGESVVIRILSRDSELVNLARLGLDDHNAGLLRQMIHKPHGIIFVTGPTGSGKSTTLYASLLEINKTDKKILTVEDPIEYRIAGVTQVQVNDAIDLNFKHVLRSFLRQDPDVIMVGETRDPETASTAIQAALTGHLVFSTLHTNDSCGAISRLLDMGIEPFLIASSVEGLIAQRLVRLMCPHCKQQHMPAPEVLRKVAGSMLEESLARNDLQFFRPVGCEKCRFTGFRGRTALYEIVRVDEEMRAMIVERQPANVLKRHAMNRGSRNIRMDGWLKITDGKTTVDEVLRVTMEDDMAVEV